MGDWQAADRGGKGSRGWLGVRVGESLVVRLIEDGRKEGDSAG